MYHDSANICRCWLSSGSHPPYPLTLICSVSAQQGATVSISWDREYHGDLRASDKREVTVDRAGCLGVE
jgi:hypothetical protein